MESHTLASLSLSLTLLRFFSLPPTRLLARAHTDTLLAVLVQSKRIHGAFRASLFFNLTFLSLFFSLSFSSFHLTLYSPLVSLTYCRIRSVPRTHSSAPLTRPSPLPPSHVLISVLGRPACTHTSYLRLSPVYTRELSLSLSREQTRIPRARA